MTNIVVSVYKIETNSEVEWVDFLGKGLVNLLFFNVFTEFIASRWIVGYHLLNVDDRS